MSFLVGFKFADRVHRRRATEVVVRARVLEEPRREGGAEEIRERRRASLLTSPGGAIK